MPDLIFATGNTIKFNIAGKTCAAYGIKLSQSQLEIDEVQSEDPLYIGTKKAEKAYEALARPVVVADDSWSIPALNGFPGPYMKSINHWFGPQDLLNLMQGKKDRRAILTQVLVYKDESGQKVFVHETPGEILQEARGGGNETSGQIISMQGDNGKTIAEMYLSEGNHDERSPAAVWHEFAKWYKEYAK